MNNPDRKSASAAPWRAAVDRPRSRRALWFAALALVGALAVWAGQRWSANAVPGVVAHSPSKTPRIAAIDPAPASAAPAVTGASVDGPANPTNAEAGPGPPVPAPALADSAAEEGDACPAEAATLCAGLPDAEEAVAPLVDFAEQMSAEESAELARLVRESQAVTSDAQQIAAASLEPTPEEQALIDGAGEAASGEGGPS